MAEERYPSRTRSKPVLSQFGDDKKDKSDVVIAKGKGEELGDIGYIADELKTKGEEFCQVLHRILYGTPGSQRTRRADIRKFSGFPAPWTADQIKDKKLSKLTQTSLKSLCKLFDCEPDTDDKDRDDYEDAIAAFLLKPKSTGKKSSAKKSSAKGSSKKGSRKSKSKKDKDAPKRPPSAYFIFANEKRGSVLKKHPGYGVTEVAKKLGEKWRGLSSAEKKPYEKQAVAAKEKYEKELKAYKKKAKAKKHSDSDEAESASSSDEKDRKRKDDSDKDDDDDDDEPKAKKQRKAKPAED